MTPKEVQQMKRLIRMLNQAANLADSLEACVGNPREVAAILGGIARKLEVEMNKANNAAISD